MRRTRPNDTFSVCYSQGEDCLMVDKGRGIEVIFFNVIVLDFMKRVKMLSFTLEEKLCTDCVLIVY